MTLETAKKVNFNSNYHDSKTHVMTCGDQIGSKLIIKLPINSTAKVKISELRVKNLATFQILQGDFLSLELTILQGSNVLRGSEWACGQCRV